MKKLTQSFPAKVSAVFLSVLLCYGIALCAADQVAAYEYGFYTEDVGSYFETDDCLRRMQNDARVLYRQLLEHPSQPQAPSDLEPEDPSLQTEAAESSPIDAQPAPLDGMQLILTEGQSDYVGYYYELDDWHADETNFRFAAYDPASGAVYANDYALVFQLTDKLFNETSGVTLWENLLFLREDMLSQNEQAPLVPDAASPSIRFITLDNYVFCVGVAQPLSGEGGLPVRDGRDGYARAYRLFHLVSETYIAAAVLLVLFIILLVSDIIFLCCAAGRRAGQDEPVLNYQDRIPLDLYLMASLFGMVLCVSLMDFFWSGNYLVTIGMSVLLLTGAFLLALATLLTLCTRIKVGKWWRNTVIFQCCRLCWRICRAIFRWTGRMAGSLAYTWRVALVCAAVVLFNLFCASTNMYGSTTLLFLTVNLGASLAVCSTARQIQLLKQAGAALASGVLGQEIDTSRLYGDLRIHGEHLNSLNQGMAIALDQKMRSERLKTELITNVSHDIKTPLTSIINYVDLLQKTNDEEQRQQYLTVLDRQAKRLKKLTEDLVEASKASTGNLPVNLLPTNLQEIIDQAIGEYEDRLIASQLEVVVTLPEKPLSAIADGRLLWRVLDNLLNNACKYAQKGTRVYLDACARGNLTVISMKNISHQQLNLSPDELMERFVRGDSSRNTEGSGLGLNIAKSLVELQHGYFTLAIDGDLFKAMISLPLYQPEEIVETERTVTLHE